MARYGGLSELEAGLDEEFEFLLDEQTNGREATGDEEFEADLDRYAEAADEELDEEYEYEGVEEEAGDDFGQRFYELSAREWESESDLEAAIGDLLGEMEREYFWGAIKRGLKKGAKGLLKKGLKFAKGQIPAFKVLQSMTQLARGDLKGLLGSLAKAGLASAIPGGAVALPALQALGFEAGQDQDGEREAWDNFARVARESYEYLAENLTPNADQMQEAHRLAYAAFRAARPTARMRSRYGYGVSRIGGYGRPLRRVSLGPGERLLVTRRG